MATVTPAPSDVVVDDAVCDDLVTRLVEHCSMACVTGAEDPIATAVAAHHEDRGEVVVRMGNSLVVTAAGFDPAADRERPRVVLAGHLDVVAPTDDDREPRIEERDGVQVVVGRGASDMKAGNVVAMRLFEQVADGRLAADVDVVLVLYAGEEGPAEGNELTDVLDRVDWLHTADLVVVLEPTDGEVHLGCLGGLHATLSVHGQQAHSARPWHGRNALEGAASVVLAFGLLEPVEMAVGDVTFHDVWSITQASTPNGRNVIPGRVNLNLNFRFSPTRDLATAEAELRDVVAATAETLELDIEVEITDRAPPAPPATDDPLVAHLCASANATVTGKQAWTDVARFAGLGVPAVNFGPGRTDQAHQRGEYVEVWRLRAVHDVLERFVASVGDHAPT